MEEHNMGKDKGNNGPLGKNNTGVWSGQRVSMRGTLDR